MARLKMKKKEMSRQFAYLFLFFHSLCQICHSLETVESHNQAFIQTDKHLTYIVGDVSSGIPIEVKPGSVYNELVGSEDVLISSTLQLNPPMLDFQEQAVGMPRMEQVIVQNTDGKNNLHLLSISGSTAHFHCSFFQDKIVPPGGNTTFDVVFLARQEGNVENTLYIHTSLGSFKYQVFGVGIANPYRLRPYIGARVPVNSSFAPLINMHNPHSTTLQVLEMFSSEGDLHLELPTGEKQAPKSLWEIPPYETKTIMKANFIGRTEHNHTAFIRIKTNNKKDKQLVVLPMEVEVTSSPGIYVAQELIDFGIVRTFDDPKTVPINLINTGESPVQISSITVSPPNEAISLDFRPVKLHPDLLRQVTVAHITFRASKALHPKLWSGRIIIKAKNNLHKISIPYEAKVLHGSLTYHKNMTYFFASTYPINYTRFMEFTNTFNFSLVLYNVTLPPEMKGLFSILNFTKPVILEPQILMTPFLLNFHPKVAQMHFRTVLSLHTNASIFDIEIIIYNGQLKIIPHRPEKFEGQLDFGTMGVKENKSVYFTLVNDNPIEIQIDEYSTDMKGATLTVLGIERGNSTVLSRKHNTTAINVTPLVIWPYHYAVFSLKLVAPEEEGSYQAEVIFATQFQETFMPVLVRTSEGSLHAIPEKIFFDKVFPGKIPMKVLQVHSTFHDYQELKSVSFQPPDSRFYFINEKEDKEDIAGNRLLVLEPQTNNTIGRVYYNSKKECRDDCYVGLPTHTPAGHQWLLGLHLDKDVSETDHYLYTNLRNKWLRIQEKGKDRVNVTIEIDTSTVQGFLFSAHVQHHWPDVIRKCRSQVKFPLTQIGNLSTIDIIVENPGDTMIIVQVLPLHLYPNPQTIVELLKHRLPSYFSEYMETDDTEIFTLPELEILNPKPDSVMNKFRKTVDDTMGVKSNGNTITAYLDKGVKIKVNVGFKPKDDSLKTSLIIVRNNLTIIDAILLEGQGGRGEMKLNNRKPGVSTLQFDIAEKHLKNCDKRKHTKNMVPNFTVKRSFTLKNTGELPFYVHGYSINNAPCEGYGFRVLDCEGYDMLPNTSRKIDIAFTPDFTMSRIQRILTVYTSLGSAFNYTLQATVPPHTLSKCSASLPRPNWEPVLYYSIVCVMGFLLFCILVASYFEADRIFVADILKRKVRICNGTPPYQKDKIFDLKSLGTNVTLHISQPPSIKPQMVNKLPPSMTRPIIEMSNANSHVEHKSREPFMSTLVGIFKSMFVRTSLPVHKKVDNNNIETLVPINKITSLKTTSDRPATPTHAPIKPTSADKERSHPHKTHESIITEKSNPTHSQPQQKITLRKNKAAKRSHTENADSISTVTHTTPNDRKTGNNNNSYNKSNTNSAEKKSVEPVNIVKEKTTPTPNITSDSSGLASFGDAKIYDNGKQKGKKKLRSKPERDNIIKERLLLRQQEEKDETSSTTTESSTGEVEEKSVRESTPEPPPPPKPKKARNKSHHLEPLVIPGPEEDVNANDFELTSKSRAYKKIKGQIEASGDTLKSSSMGITDISLPYRIQDKNKQKKKTTTVAGKPADKKPDKPKGNMCDLDDLDDITMDTHASESDSSPPLWDEPLPPTHADDLSELSIQTDQFAAKQSRQSPSHNVIANGVTGTTPTSFSPEALTSSSRSSSYSSIVSNSSGDGPGIKNKGDKQRYPVGFTPFSETMTMPAPLTPLTPPMTTSSQLRNAWGTSTNPSTPETPIGFGLQTIQESSRTGNMLTDTQADMGFNQPTFSFGTSVSSSVDPVYGFTANTYDQQSNSLTMMQRLQQDRRRRMMEYQNRIRKGDDWPGFDQPIRSSESLWDSEYNPMDSNVPWSVAPDSPTENGENGNGLWSSLTSSANQSWNSLMGIWGGNNPPTSGNNPLTPPLTTDTSYTPNDAGHATGSTGSPNAENLNAFNPFHSNIWGPNASTASTGWGMPPPGQQTTPNEDKDN